ncbi:MAG: PD40 domain-containing protein [Ignavibacteria bacterium]|nr:PD40 domain-containing protein [Ignavibacteria bacterium]
MNLTGNPYPALGIIDTSGNITATDSLGYASDADWSPDGSRLICSAIRRTGTGITNLYIVDAATGRSTRLLSDSIRTGAVSWSQQNTIGFAFASGGTANLAIIDTNGTNLRVLDSTAYFNTIKWSPDGSKVLYTRNFQSTYEVYTLAVSNSQKQLLLHFEDGTQITSLRYSPDGTMISFYAYQSSTFSLYVMGSDGSNPRSVASQSTDGSWSPDSKSLAYVYYNVVYTKRVQ